MKYVQQSELIHCYYWRVHLCKIPQQLGRNKDGNNNPLLCRDEQMGSPFRLFFHSTAAAAACKIDSDILTTMMVKKGADQISVI